MRWSRLAVMSGVAAIVLLSAGWRLSASQHRVSPKPAAMALGHIRVPGALRQQLARYLAGRPLGRRLPAPPAGRGIQPLGQRVPPLRQGAARPGPCYVGVGSCSLIPCVQFVGGRPPMAGSNCQGRLGAPKVLRVATP
jgi:hypothetical protein